MPAAVGPYGSRTTNVNGLPYPLAYDPNTNTQAWVGWRSSTKKINTATRTRGSSVWSYAEQTAALPAFTDCSDDHRNFSAAYDGNSKLHVYGGTHSEPILAYRATNVGDYQIDAWQTLPLLSGNLSGENISTYWYPLRLNDGDILELWRAGGSGNGTFLLYRYNQATGLYTSPISNMFAAADGATTRSFYPHRPIISPSRNPNPGRLHVAGTWRNAVGSDQSNQNLYYVYSDPPYTSVHAADGTLMTLPMVLSNMSAAIVKVVPQGSGLLNNQALAIDDQDRPLLVQYWDVGGEGTFNTNTYGTPGGPNLSYQLMYWDGAAWNQKDVSPFPGSRPIALWKNGYCFVFFTGYASTEGTGIWCRYARKVDNYDDWTVVQISSTNVNDYSPAHDEYLWREYEQLDLAVQRAVFGGSFTIIDLTCLEVTITVG